MLRVGLTGELGSGKSTVAAGLAARGAVVLSSDEIGRGMMQPGEPVYKAIVERFGSGVLLGDGRLDRPKLARLAFDPADPQVEALNAIVHPAVLAEQERRIAKIAAEQPRAIVVIESALIFTTKHGAGNQPWRQRFDQVVCVTAPDAVKVQRYATRVSQGQDLTGAHLADLKGEAERRLAAQRISPEQMDGALVLENVGDLAALTSEIDALWRKLQEVERARFQVRPA